MISSFGVPHRSVFTLLKRPGIWSTQHFKYYAKEIYERGKARENTYFLKIQYDQLIRLKNKFLKRREQLDKAIKELTKAEKEP